MMRRLIFLALGSILAVGLFSASTHSPVWPDHVYVAHALGGYLGEGEVGDELTNSLETAERSYELGFRSFEVDLVLLGDGTVFAAHDGFETHYGLDAAFSEVTWADVKDRQYPGASGPLPVARLEDIVDWMIEHPDVWMHLDAKGSTADRLQIFSAVVEIAPPSVLARMIPLTFTEEMEASMAIYDWTGYLIRDAHEYSRREVEAVLESHPGGGVLIASFQMVPFVPQLGVPVFVHATNSRAHVLDLVDQGFSVYAQDWIGDDFTLTR